MLELVPGRLHDLVSWFEDFARHPANSCNSRIWLIELSKMLPSSTQLDGFDVDLTQSPPRQWLPSNVAMHKLDAFSSLTQDLVGKYDIVHLRLFIVLIKHNDPVPLLRNLISMLSKDSYGLTGLIYAFLAWLFLGIADLLVMYNIEPGGYIQWDEHDHVSQKVVTADPAADPKSVHALLEFVRPLDDMMGPRTCVASALK